MLRHITLSESELSSIALLSWQQLMSTEHVRGKDVASWLTLSEISLLLVLIVSTIERILHISVYRYRIPRVWSMRKPLCSIYPSLLSSHALDPGREKKEKSSILMRAISAMITYSHERYIPERYRPISSSNQGRVVHLSGRSQVNSSVSW